MKIDHRLMASLMAALQAEEQKLAVAKSELEQARIEYDLASSRFVAVRDLFKRRLGGNPYSARMTAIHNVGTLWANEYRFLGMNPTDAAIEVLEEASYPLPLEQIIERIEAGGLKAPGLSRSVNAALMNRAGIGRDKEGNYYYDAGIAEDEEVAEE
jgi:hypothetical protein